MSALNMPASPADRLVEALNIGEEVVELLNILCLAAAQTEEGSRYCTLGRLIEMRVVDMRNEVDAAHLAFVGGKRPW